MIPDRTSTPRQHEGRAPPIINHVTPSCVMYQPDTHHVIKVGGGGSRVCRVWGYGGLGSGVRGQGVLHDGNDDTYMTP